MTNAPAAAGAFGRLRDRGPRRSGDGAGAENGERHGREVREEAAEREGVEDLVEAEPARPRVGPLGAVDDAARGVEQTAEADERADERTTLAPERHDVEDRGPAECQVERGVEP